MPAQKLRGLPLQADCQSTPAPERCTASQRKLGETLRAAGHQTSESGKDALRFVMNSWSSSSTPGSMGGASYSRSIRFQIALARCAASSEPASCHCSKELLSEVSAR